MLAADLAFDLPLVAPLARKSGNTLACAEDATRLLEAGELVGVWPEGYKGLGKPYRERYQLQRFGRGGFVEVALRTGAPIVPVAVVGSEEIYPMLANLRRLARLHLARGEQVVHVLLQRVHAQADRQRGGDRDHDHDGEPALAGGVHRHAVFLPLRA